MFIRSQNKRILLQAERLDIDAIDVPKFEQRGSQGYYAITAGFTEIGIYSTEERAIEVLGWIMEAIENEENTFQMPQELEPVFTGTRRK